MGALFKGINLDGLKWQVFVTEAGFNFSLGMVGNWYWISGNRYIGYDKSS
jgi:hypothetical protein